MPIWSWLATTTRPKSCVPGLHSTAQPARRPWFVFQYSGLTATGPLDSFSVSGDATPDQVSELASRLSRAYDTRIVVRRTQLIPVPQLNMTSGQPTGNYLYFDPEVAERAWQPEGDKHELN